LELNKKNKKLDPLVRIRSNIEMDGFDRLIARDNDIEEKFAVRGLIRDLEKDSFVVSGASHVVICMIDINPTSGIMEILYGARRIYKRERGTRRT
jgi:hypothetical protein